MPHLVPRMFLLLTAMACSGQQNGQPSTRVESRIETEDSTSSFSGMDSAEARFLAAYSRKDLDGILALYTDDIRFVIDGRVLEGKEAIRKAWVQSLPTLSGLTFKPVTRSTRDDVGVSLESFSQRYAEPGKPVQMDSGYSMAVLRRQPDNRWLYQTVALSRPPEKPAETSRKQSPSR